MANQISLRRDTSANWVSVDPILAQGELGLELDTSRAKYGDAVRPWSELPYWPSGTGTGNATILDETSFPTPFPGETPILLWQSDNEALFVGTTGVGNWVQVGSQGSIGGTGVQGPQGVTGLGATGLQGPAGSTGAAGATGLQGQTGLEGQAGPAGLTGVPGVQGLTGANGITGSIGVQGITGSIGLSLGVTGLSGSTGIQGPTGVAGSTGLAGLGNFTQNAFTPATQFPELRWSFADEAVYLGTTGVGGNWIQLGAGGQGVTGLNGIQGSTGLRGATGLHGDTGVQGRTGLQGNTGVRGYPSTGSTTTATSISINIGTNDVYKVTALATDTTVSWTGSPVDNMMLLTRINDNSSSHATNFSSTYFESLTVAKPTVTTATKEQIAIWLYRSSSGKYGCVYTANAL